MSIVVERRERRAVGVSVPRVDARAKATGRMLYTGDWELSGMLEVAVARSTRPHALLRSLDVTRAREIDGVVDILTGRELFESLGERHRTGPAFQDQPILAHDRVRYVGEPIAAVVARDVRTARQAAATIIADYEEPSRCSKSTPPSRACPTSTTSCARRASSAISAT